MKRPRMHALHMAHTSVIARILFILGPLFQSDPPVLRSQKVTADRVEVADELAKAVILSAEPAIVSTTSCRRFARKQNNQPATNAMTACDVSFAKESSQAAEDSTPESALKAPARRLKMMTRQIAIANAIIAIGPWQLLLNLVCCRSFD